MLLHEAHKVVHGAVAETVADDDHLLAARVVVQLLDRGLERREVAIALLKKAWRKAPIILYG